MQPLPLPALRSRRRGVILPLSGLLLSVLPVLLVLLVLLGGSAAGALEVRFHPGDVLYVYENAGEGTPPDLTTAVIHNIAFVNDGEEAVTLRGARIDVRLGDRLMQTRHLDRATLDRSATTFHRLHQGGALAAYDFQFQTSRYLEGVTFAATTTLQPGEAIVVLRQAFLFDGLPDTVTVVADAVDAQGAAVPAEGSLRVVDHQSPNDYVFPVRGTWLVAAAPSLHSHHRWAPIQEFAFDLVRIGAGGLSHHGDGERLDQYHAYGAQVMAIADGVVVSADGSMGESDRNLRRADESDEAYQARMMAHQQELMAGGFERILGNHVVVRHAHDEYSHYAHLRPGSVTVKAGDRVRQGQVLGALGHSGNSTEPHLHVHLTDGPDRAYSRSLPMEFVDLALWPSANGTLRHIHSGQTVISER